MFDSHCITFIDIYTKKETSERGDGEDCLVCAVRVGVSSDCKAMEAMTRLTSEIYIQMTHYIAAILCYGIIA
jgi:hypothetical protein